MYPNKHFQHWMPQGAIQWYTSLINLHNGCHRVLYNDAPDPSISTLDATGCYTMMYLTHQSPHWMPQSAIQWYTWPINLHTGCHRVLYNDAPDPSISTLDATGCYTMMHITHQSPHWMPQGARPWCTPPSNVCTGYYRELKHNVPDPEIVTLDATGHDDFSQQCPHWIQQGVRAWCTSSNNLQIECHSALDHDVIYQIQTQIQTQKSFIQPYIIQSKFTYTFSFKLTDHGDPQ